MYAKILRWRRKDTEEKKQKNIELRKSAQLLKGEVELAKRKTKRAKGKIEKQEKAKQSKEREEECLAFAANTRLAKALFSSALQQKHKFIYS